MRRTLLVALPAFVLVIMIAVASAGGNEAEAVKLAVMDYVEGVYQVDASRIERSVHPDLAKRGFYFDGEAKRYRPHTMTYQELVELAKNYNKDGRVPKTAPKDVEIFDISDQTASVKLTAHWGIDYMHLAKYEGKWKIINVLWQTPPRPE